MKALKYILLVSLFSSITSILISQSSKKEWALAPELGLQQYKGEFGDQFLSGTGNISFGISLNKYLTPTWDLMMIGTYSITKDTRGNDYFKAKGTDLNLAAKLKMNNGKILKENSFIAPYLFVGLGDYFGRVYGINTPSSKVISPNFLGGMGLGFNITKSLSLDARVKYSYLWTDKIDNDITETIINDQFLNISVGIAYKFTTQKDTDNDGVVDKKDDCPKIAGLSNFNGCPDTDGDGFKDSDDGCPLIAGKLNGCPDSDNDGIANKEDGCPNKPGIKELNGCPDRDGDGVKDSEDRCPDKPGKIKGCPDTDGDGIADNRDDCPNKSGRLNGCPDIDNDGVADKNDKCPAIKGTLFGCPDKDKDGVIDRDDKCPTESGTAKNNGCPEIKEEVKKIFTEAMEGLFFNSGSAVITPSSYRVLDKVVTVLNQNQELKLTIEGHTDNTGDINKNLELSKKRALSAKKYLISKGINPSRLNSTGYGITKPRNENSTPKGRKLNRRVEFNPLF